VSRPDARVGHASRRGVLRLAALAAIGALLAAGCGARWDDDQKAEVAARYAGGEAGANQQAAAGDVTSGEGVADGAGDGEAVTGTTAQATSGGATSGESGGPVASGSKPCAAASKAPGVTDDQISVGSISSLSGPVPGIAASAAGAARAYVAFLNANGGVCGRQVVLREADDGTDNGRYRSVVNELGPTVLGLVGGFGAGDVGAVDVLTQQKLPGVIVPSGKSVSDVPTIFDINPRYHNQPAVIGKYRYLRDQGATSVAVVYLAIEQSRAEARMQQALMEKAGLKIALVHELPLSTLSFDSAARKVANSGANYLFFIGDANSNAGMARAMADTGYKLKVNELLVFGYGGNFIERAGSASDGVSTWIRYLPTEDAGSNPSLSTFVEWMGRAAPGQPKDSFAADSRVAAKAFFDALESLPGPITREALVAQLAKIGTFDAGGMYGPIQLGAKRTNYCFVGLKVIDGKWKRMTPAKGFLC
jgi:ABC-type branched-subunit amino acid transport system substrate-binding protein